MSWVYSIAVLQDQYVMVYNPKRHGWEMPGGRIEPGETSMQAVIREFKEECGCGFLPFASKEHREGTVFAGILQSPCAPAEMKWATFSELPGDISFPDEDYAALIEWARKRFAEYESK
jgi:8-oxo-dGTP diphosphatase